MLDDSRSPSATRRRAPAHDAIEGVGMVVVAATAFAAFSVAVCVLVALVT